MVFVGLFFCTNKNLLKIPWPNKKTVKGLFSSWTLVFAVFSSAVCAISYSLLPLIWKVFCMHEVGKAGGISPSKIQSKATKLLAIQHSKSFNAINMLL